MAADSKFIVAVRRFTLHAGLAISLSSLCFGLGWTAHRFMSARPVEANGTGLAEPQANMARTVLRARERQMEPSGTGGLHPGADMPAGGSAQRALIDEVKRQLQSEMGLFPVRLLRERRKSFVEVNSVDSSGTDGYGTAGYLGNGYFITVKHAVIGLGESSEERNSHRIKSVSIRYKDGDLPVQVVDSGDATAEVHRGDWAIIHARESVDLPPLRVNIAYGFDFAEPIFRLGNDYSKGIILSTGYVGQRMPNGLVTCLTDGHPGASGGGVLNQQGELVGISIGRMPADYRFSFILPLREEMFQKVPAVWAAVAEAE